jgi:hypothetical protein
MGAAVLAATLLGGCLGGSGSEGQNSAGQGAPGSGDGGIEATVGTPAPEQFPTSIGSYTLREGAFPGALYEDGASFAAAVYAKDETVDTALTSTTDRTAQGGWECGLLPLEAEGLDETEAQVEQMLGQKSACARPAYEGTLAVIVNSERYDDTARFGDDFIAAWQ